MFLDYLSQDLLTLVSLSSMTSGVISSVARTRYWTMLKMMKKMDDLLRNCRSFVGVALMWKAYKDKAKWHWCEHDKIYNYLVSLLVSQWLVSLFTCWKWNWLRAQVVSQDSAFIVKLVISTILLGSALSKQSKVF